MGEDIYDLIIIGSGPAGITAGIYASRLGMKSIIISKELGGQLTRKSVSIENYPGLGEISGYDLVQKFYNHLKKFNVPLISDAVVKVEEKNGVFEISTEGRKVFFSKTVIVASGADPRPLEVPGEKEFIGKGVSYCAVCDAPFYKDKTVAVAGGGDAGFEAAIALSEWAKKVYILEFNPEVKAEPANQKKAAETGKVEVITNARLKEIKGDQTVELIIYEDRKSGEKNELKLDGVFVEIGNQPATSFLKGLIDFSERDEIKIDPWTCQTKTPGLFAAGDVSNVKEKQIVIACGEGAKAALSAYHYLKRSLGK